MEELAHKYTSCFANIKDVSPRDKVLLTRDCHKCVYELGCHDNPVDFKDYKRDAPDGGYY